MTTSRCEVVFQVAGGPVASDDGAESGAVIVATGGAEELGSWRPSEALQLRQDESGLWTGKTTLTGTEAVITIEYKYVLIPGAGTDANPIWEDGGNRVAGIPDMKRMLVKESWGKHESDKETEDIGDDSGVDDAPDGQHVLHADQGEEEAVSAAPEEPPAAVEDEAPPAEDTMEVAPAVVAAPVTEGEMQEQSTPQLSMPEPEVNQAAAEPVRVTPTVVVHDDEADEGRDQLSDLGSPRTVPASDAAENGGDDAVASNALPVLDLSQARPKPRSSAAGGRTGLTVTSERAMLWVMPVNGVPEQHEHNQLFSANQTNYSQLALETLASGVRPLIVASLCNPKTHLNFAEGPKGARLRADAFTHANPDPITTLAAVLLKYLLKEKAQFLKEPLAAEAQQRLLRASYGLIAVTNNKAGAATNGNLLSPRAPLSPIIPQSPAFGLGTGLISPEDGTVDVVEDTSILLRHLSEIKQFRNGVAVPDNAQRCLQYALSNTMNIMKVRDSLDHNGHRLEELNQEPIEHRRVLAQDILAQCAAQLDRDDVLEAVIDGLAARVSLR